MELIDVLKALGDKNRLRIVNLLAGGELCVCMLAEVLETSQPNASKQLNRLRYSGIIRCRKIAQWCFYGLTETFRREYAGLYKFLLDKMGCSVDFARDIRTLGELMAKEQICEEQRLARKQSGIN